MLFIYPALAAALSRSLRVIVHDGAAFAALGLTVANAPSSAATDGRAPPRAAALVAEVLATGMQWAEGPLWVPARSAEAARIGAQSGFLLWSDVKEGTVWRWSPADPRAAPIVHLRPSGCTPPGCDAAALVEPGANGLALDAKGRLHVCEHGNRRVVRRNADGTTTVIASHYRGRRLNSPNDLALDGNGHVFFTDPSYGLNGKERDPQREQRFNGVYRARLPDEDSEAAAQMGGSRFVPSVQLVTSELTRPNGVAVLNVARGQHEHGHLLGVTTTIMVANSNSTDRKWVRLAVPSARVVDTRRELILRPPKPLRDAAVPGNPDGLAFDAAGRMWASGPEGVLVYSAPRGASATRALVARIIVGQKTANVAFGVDDDDARRKWLYVCAGDSVLRLAVAVDALPLFPLLEREFVSEGVKDVRGSESNCEQDSREM